MGGSVYDALYHPDPWFRTLFDDFRDLAADELPAPYFSGCEFTSVCINTATYLQWLLGQCLKNGVVVKRGILSHLTEARKLSHTGEDANFVINCTGLGSLKLGGVEDETMAPARGQIVVVRNECTPMFTTSGTDDGSTEVSYLMSEYQSLSKIPCFVSGSWSTLADSISARGRRRHHHRWHI